MSMKTVKRKLRRRGSTLYTKYFFNPENIINEVVKSYDNNLVIDDEECEVVFDTSQTSIEQIYELILYYPNLLREKKIITDDIIKSLYSEYSETINLMNENIGSNVRSRLSGGASVRASEKDLDYNIISEDIKLIRFCPFLGIKLKYNSSKICNNSPSLDKIDPTKGYIKGNIQVISLLANQMKSSANKEELITFAKSVLEMYN